MMLDPRTSVISQRLSGINRIIAVSSGKGGVGKSMIATTLALSLVKQGCSVGLFDLDFTSPSTHVILGANNLQPIEEKGLIPPNASGIKFMSLIYFSGDNPAPLRGADVSNALIELLAVTQWGKLDFLIIDTPPGIGDILLDLIRFIKRIEFLIVTTQSLLAFETVKKQVDLLCEQNTPFIGVIENMKQGTSRRIKQETAKLNLPFLGSVGFDMAVEDAIGRPSQLLETSVGKKIMQITQQVILKQVNRDGL
jgi:ATP-binding protein involved in chromosome partitioning